MWNKRSLIFNKWHSQLPTVVEYEGCLRIYCSSRDNNNKSNIFYLDVKKDDPSIVLDVQIEPILTKGERGCFDDCGVMPGSIVVCEKETRLYYTGWNSDKGEVPYGHGIGLASSLDSPSQRFERYSNGPLLDRSPNNPYLVNSPFVLRPKSDEWIMFYCRGNGWRDSTPFYGIGHAVSRDGINWNPGSKPVFGGEEEAISRPYVLIDGDVWKMWYSFKTLHQSYRMGYAESRDQGQNWNRIDSGENIIEPSSAETWDSDMICYPWIHKSENRIYLFYNGNGYGASGIGWAEWE